MDTIMTVNCFTFSQQYCTKKYITYLSKYQSSLYDSTRLRLNIMYDLNAYIIHFINRIWKNKQ